MSEYSQTVKKMTLTDWSCLLMLRKTTNMLKGFAFRALESSPLFVLLNAAFCWVSQCSCRVISLLAMVSFLFVSILTVFVSVFVYSLFIVYCFILVVRLWMGLSLVAEFFLRWANGVRVMSRSCFVSADYSSMFAHMCCSYRLQKTSTLIQFWAQGVAIIAFRVGTWLVCVIGTEARCYGLAFDQ